MPYIWLGFFAICFFMFIFTMDNLNGNPRAMLAIAWFVAAAICVLNAGRLYLVERHQPSRKERNTAYWDEHRKKYGRQR